MGGAYPTAQGYRAGGVTIRAPGPSAAYIFPISRGEVATIPKTDVRPPPAAQIELSTKQYRWKIPPVPKTAFPDPWRWWKLVGRANPYLLAFEVGFLVGSVLFNRDSTLLIRNPGGWEEYICPGYGDGTQGPLQESATRYPQVLGVDGANCISGQFVAGAPAPGDDFGVWEDYGVFIRRRHRATFGQATAPEPGIVPTVRWGRRAAPLQVAPELVRALAPVHWTNPDLVPIGAPAIWPQPSPLWSKNRPLPRPEFREAGDGQTVTSPVLGRMPGLQPVTVTPPVAVPAPGTAGNPLTRNPTRPGPRTKERKIRGARAIFLAGQAMNAVTETGDFVEAMYDAIDKDCAKRAGGSASKTVWKPGYNVGHMGEDGKNWRWKPGRGWAREVGYYVPVGLQQQMEAVYRYADCIDVEKALINVIENQIEDAVLGSVNTNKASKNRRPHGRLPVGFELGPAL